MQTAVIIDIAVAAVLLGFLAGGAHRGLFRSVAGLVIVIVALAGAGYAANYVAPKAERYVQPYIEKKIQSRINASVPAEKKTTASPTETSRADVMHALGLMSLDTDASDTIAKAAEKKIQDTGASIRTAIEESFAETILHTLLFVLFFFLLLLLLKWLIHALDLLLKLPGLNFLNRLGGAALGLMEGALLLFFAVWILRRFGVTFQTKTVEDTVLLRFFTTNTPLSALSFL